MKYLMFLLFFHLYTVVLSQSISKTKILEYLEIQDIQTIKASLENKGFTYDKQSISYGATLYWFHKDDELGIELIQIGKNDELFMFLYVPSKQFFSSYKEILITNDFEYKYSSESDKYYENGEIRIGVSDVKGIISTFIELK